MLGVDPDRPGGDYVVAAGDDGVEEGARAEPRPLNDDQKLSLAVDRLAGNEKLLGALAWRLGIPLADVRPDGREPPLARDRGEDEEELGENREQIEVIKAMSCAVCLWFCSCFSRSTPRASRTIRSSMVLRIPDRSRVCRPGFVGIRRGVGGALKPNYLQ